MVRPGQMVSTLAPTLGPSLGGLITEYYDWRWLFFMNIVPGVAVTIAFPGIAGYSGSKSAIDRMTRIAAAEAGKLGYGVRVNCIYPGLVPTEMGSQLAQDVVTLGLFPSVPEAIGAVVGLTPQGRLGEVADMADAVVFLASDAARFITGAGLPVDGGMGM